MAKRDVALVIHDGVQSLDVAGPLDVFTEANGFLDADERYRCLLVADTTALIRASNGTPMAAHESFSHAARVFHTVLVAGGPAFPRQGDDEAISAWLRQWGTRAERYGSICTGAFALGHAGLLDGRLVTTHWQNAARLAE
ncbi:MAG: DJ-1/PfpI family protein, partial [Nitratireductor sp.]